MPAPPPWTHRLPTTAARKHLSEIVTRVQDPRSFCVLTRHGKPMAAIVPMSALKRIQDLEDIEDVALHGHRPAKFRFGMGGARSNAEAAEAVLKLQMDRKVEREVLANAGLEPIPGGELVGEVAKEVKRKWWWGGG